MFPRTLSRRPAGFTLVELLVVISIIAVLAALTTAAVQKVREVGKRTQVKVEIDQISMNLDTFKQRFNVRELACRGNGVGLPSAALLNNIGTFVLRKNYGAPGSVTVPDYTQTYEYRYLKQLFPAADFGADSTTYNNGLPDGTELDSAQLIVFWLGGYYFDTNASAIVVGQGFNADARFPFISNGTPAAKKGPLFDFPTNRLATSAGNPIPRFLDPWGTPYCFFATENGRDNNYAMRSTPTPQCVSFTWNSTTMVPLLTKANQYANQKTHQVFSAGKNKTFAFAAGTNVPALWVPGINPFMLNGQGAENFSNFSATILSAP